VSIGLTTMKSAAVAALLGAALLAASACHTQSYGPVPTFSFTFEVPRGGSGSGSGDGSGCVTGSLEGCYDYDHMKAFIDRVIVDFVRPFVASQYPGLQPLRSILYVPSGATGPEDCVTQSGQPAQYSSYSYEYCPADVTIYLGQDAIWGYYQLGDAAPAAGLAHEWGHHIQKGTGVPEPGSASETVVHENQADCIAGAWVDYASRQGEIEYPDDIVDLSDLLDEIASGESASRTHGDLQERTSSFERGVAGGLYGCNSFYPSTPIIGGTG
jgi:Putative neutral zinc metallopeptidase